MIIGKLYQINKYYWLLYPSKDKVATAAKIALGLRRTGDATATAAYYSKRFNCNVSYIEPNSIFCLLEKDERYCKILSTEGNIGWILYPENEGWAKGSFEEVKENS